MPYRHEDLSSDLQNQLKKKGGHGSIYLRFQYWEHEYRQVLEVGNQPNSFRFDERPSQKIGLSGHGVIFL